MCRNRRKHLRRCFPLAGGLCVVLLVGTVFAGCGSKKKVLSDVGTDLSEEKDVTAYLDKDVLSEQKEYKTYTLSRGTYTAEEIQEAGYSSPYVRQPLVVETGGYTMTLLNTDQMNNYQGVIYGYHEAGSLLATVSVEIDPVDIQEARVKLARLEERYARDQQEFLQQREKDIAKNDRIGDLYEFEAGCILLERKVLEWENRARIYEQQIREAKQTLADLEKWSQLTEITAPESGIYWEAGTQEGDSAWTAGDKIKDGEVFCYRLSYDDCLFLLENTSSIYRYGMEASWKIIHWQDPSKSIETTGRMINATADDLYGNLETTYAYFLLDTEINDEQMKDYNSGRMSGNLGTMDNVLLVPAEAVTVEYGVCYVTVVKEDGTFLKTGFISGGFNGETYWVLEGLEEGMQILLAGS